MRKVKWKHNLHHRRGNDEQKQRNGFDAVLEIPNVWAIWNTLETLEYLIIQPIVQTVSTAVEPLRTFPVHRGAYSQHLGLLVWNMAVVICRLPTLPLSNNGSGTRIFRHRFAQ